MSKKIKVLIAIGGTGGHVFPGCHLAEHLNDKGYSVKILTDKRGKKFLKNYNNFNIKELPSLPINKKNILSIFISSIQIMYSIIRSLIYLIYNRPSIIFGMGGYASFPICIAATMLKVKFVIYENNLIIGKANKYLLPFAEKIFVAYKDLEGIPKKHSHKIFEIGNIIKKEIINFSMIHEVRKKEDKIKVLVLGGSQAAKIFAEVLPNILHQCSKKGIPLKIYQQCLPDQNEQLNSMYKNFNFDFETFNFSHNLIKYFSKINLAITRSGSSILAELTNTNTPFIAVPLPTSADNHQLKNANYYLKKNFAFLIEEKDLNDKLPSLIQDIYKNSSILEKIISNQKQYSDKNVYNNINEFLKKNYL